MHNKLIISIFVYELRQGLDSSFTNPLALQQLKKKIMTYFDFNLYTHSTFYPNASVYASYKGTLYELPKNILELYDINPREGREQLFDAVQNGDFPISNRDVADLEEYGWKPTRLLSIAQ